MSRSLLHLDPVTAGLLGLCCVSGGGGEEGGTLAGSEAAAPQLRGLFPGLPPVTCGDGEAGCAGRPPVCGKSRGRPPGHLSLGKPSSWALAVRDPASLLRAVGVGDLAGSGPKFLRAQLPGSPPPAAGLCREVKATCASVCLASGWGLPTVGVDRLGRFARGGDVRTACTWQQPGRVVVILRGEPHGPRPCTWPAEADGFLQGSAYSSRGGRDHSFPGRGRREVQLAAGSVTAGGSASPSRFSPLCGGVSLPRKFPWCNKDVAVKAVLAPVSPRHRSAGEKHERTVAAVVWAQPRLHFGPSSIWVWHQRRVLDGGGGRGG